MTTVEVTDDPVAALIDLDTGDEVRSEHVAAVLGHPEGGLKGVPEDGGRARAEKVDDGENEATARETADGLVDVPAVDRVALTHLLDPDEPLVAVLE